jgi:hypothetical protein
MYIGEGALEAKSRKPSVATSAQKDVARDSGVRGARRRGEGMAVMAVTAGVEESSKTVEPS